MQFWFSKKKEPNSLQTEVHRTNLSYSYSLNFHVSSKHFIRKVSCKQIQVNSYSNSTHHSSRQKIVTYLWPLIGGNIGNLSKVLQLLGYLLTLGWKLLTKNLGIFVQYWHPYLASSVWIWGYASPFTRLVLKCRTNYLFSVGADVAGNLIEKILTKIAEILEIATTGISRHDAEEALVRRFLPKP